MRRSRPPSSVFIARDEARETRYTSTGRSERRAMSSTTKRTMMPSVRTRSGDVATSTPDTDELKGNSELKTLRDTKKLSTKKASDYLDGGGEVATEQVFPITVVNDSQKGPKRRCFVTIKKTDSWGNVKDRVSSKLDIPTKYFDIKVGSLGDYEATVWGNPVLKAGQDLQELLDTGVAAFLNQRGLHYYKPEEPAAPKPPQRKKSVAKKTNAKPKVESGSLFKANRHNVTSGPFKYAAQANRLTDMGFQRAECEAALNKHNGNEANALNELLSSM